MCDPIFPAPGTPLRRFLDAMLCQTMCAHPEFVQAVSNVRMRQMADVLRALGWQVKMKEMRLPTEENPDQCIAFYYIGEHSLEAAIGEDYDG
jgi:hypothetical protein